MMKTTFSKLLRIAALLLFLAAAAGFLLGFVRENNALYLPAAGAVALGGALLLLHDKLGGKKE